MSYEANVYTKDALDTKDESGPKDTVDFYLEESGDFREYIKTLSEA